MNNQVDPRIAELESLASEEGIKLPYPVDLICYFERMGKIVDLVTGQVFDMVTVQPTANAQAIAYLLAEVEGEFAL